MNAPKLSQRHFAAFTLPEMGVAVGVLGLLGLVFFQVLNSGMVLYAKNTAVNVAHDEARQGILRLTRDIHAAVSVPQLRDANFSATMNVTDTFSVVPSEPSGGVARMAAGVSFQNIYSGPHYIYKDPATPTMIQIKSGTMPLHNGMRLIVPFWGEEDNMYKHQPDQSNNAFTNVFLTNGFEERINMPSPNSGQFAICYYTERVLYVVRNGSYVPDATGAFTITTAAPTAGNLNRFRLTNGTYSADSTGTVAITATPYTSGSMQRYRFENGELFLYKQRYVTTGTSGIFYWEPQGVVARYISSPTPFYVPLVAAASGTWMESTNSFQAYVAASGTAQKYNSTCNTKYVGVKLTARDPSSTNRGYIATTSLLETQIDYRSRICLYQ
jgi:hypothetical protein